MSTGYMSHFPRPQVSWCPSYSLLVLRLLDSGHMDLQNRLPPRSSHASSQKWQCHSLDLMAQGCCAGGVVGGSSQSSHRGENGRRDEQAVELRVYSVSGPRGGSGHGRRWSGTGAGRPKAGVWCPSLHAGGKKCALHCVQAVDVHRLPAVLHAVLRCAPSVLDHLEDPVTDNLMPATQYRDQYHVAH